MSRGGGIHGLRTRVIVTVGPTCRTVTVLRRMIEAGASVFRLNLSHGDHGEHGGYVTKIREAAERSGQHVAILADLPGPKIRTGRLKGGTAVQLSRRGRFSLLSRKTAGDANGVSVSYRNLWKDIREGSRVFLDDGRMELVVSDVRPGVVETRVLVGGMLEERKGVNVPDCEISQHAPTREDLRHVDWAISAGVDYVGLSFVQSAADVKRLRRHLRRRGSELPIIAKIERSEAVARLDEVAACAEGLMVARGDLGVEVPAGELPILQKHIIATAAQHGAIDITATQILESMRHQPRPTRAEASDVANAVLDGTDALMLSGETAAGQYPVRAVKALVDIARRTERSKLYREMKWDHVTLSARAEVAATVRAACAAAVEVNAKALVVFTRTGRTAQLVSELRPLCPIVAFTDEVSTARRLALVWGVSAFVIPETKSAAELFEVGRTRLAKEMRLRRGDTIITTAGSTTAAGASNVMRAETV